ncbi:intermembrane transport protein PqiB [Pseudomonas oryzihabitans]|uniref:Paraquat-inducible protein B n=1 Tax=Pseudomonas oryzihabitans TaxID=47885 RepID=A0AAJ2BGQ6_9PSED|nr:MlaD family protein [Pseudomonas psychrotolerans]MDR6233973.1 paraquat-inducible protein B [Pseudomonas psychrotolerans]MDR6356941.1 paraquat-inducible protein B [Pseudomonas psychrotolerans]QDD90150.1 mammalian cell entry protein [Pseudomonas psychrotolerans]
MTDRHEPDALAPTPEVRRSRWSVSLIWLVPIVAALIGLSMVVHSWASRGPAITVTFLTAEGLEAGKTQVKYKNVVIGTVTDIQLAPDRNRVIITIDLEKSAEGFATQGARYWVVRPRFGVSGVSGVDTLLSGPFIGADIGDSTEKHYDFRGLEQPPALIHGASGKRFLLTADDLGSLDVGSPIYYRRIQVGRVVSYHLNREGTGVDAQVFIDSPYDRFVTTNSRFWNASGVDVALSASGLKLNTQSLATVVAGGIAFVTPDWPKDQQEAPEDTHYALFDDQTSALAPPDGEPHYIRMRFQQSLRGLATGAPVEFLGMNIGRVVSLTPDYDQKKDDFSLVVGAVIYPQRLGEVGKRIEAQDRDGKLFAGWVERGLRAQARTGNLLTGQLYISIDFIPNAPKVAFNPKAQPLVIPTVTGSFDRLQEQMAGIVNKIDKIPFDSIGKNLDTSLAQLSGTLKQLNTGVLPQMTTTLMGVQQLTGSASQTLGADSPVQQNLNQTLEEVQRMARSLRVFGDYLSRHPDSLIRGLVTDPPPKLEPGSRDAVKGKLP